MKFVKANCFFVKFKFHNQFMMQLASNALIKIKCVVFFISFGKNSHECFRFISPILFHFVSVSLLIFFLFLSVSHKITQTPKIDLCTWTILLHRLKITPLILLITRCCRANTTTIAYIAYHTSANEVNLYV